MANLYPMMHGPCLEPIPPQQQAAPRRRGPGMTGDRARRRAAGASSVPQPIAPLGVSPIMLNRRSRLLARPHRPGACAHHPEPRPAAAVAAAGLSGALAVTAPPAGQYPDRPIQLVLLVPARRRHRRAGPRRGYAALAGAQAAGGGGKPPGRRGRAGHGLRRRAAPDGYTLYMAAVSNAAIAAVYLQQPARPTSPRISCRSPASAMCRTSSWCRPRCP